MRLLIWVLVVGAAAGLAFWVSPRDTPTPTSSSPLAKGAATSAPAVPRAPFVGVIVPVNASDVGAVAPARVAKVFVQVGAQVKKGDPLVELDAEGLREGAATVSAAARATALEVRRARVDVEEAAARAARAKKLGIHVSAEELETTRREVRRAKLRLEEAIARNAEADARTREVTVAVTDRVLRAPFDGLVAACRATPGLTVSEGETLVRIVSGAPRVRFAIPEERLAEVAVGDTVMIELGGGSHPSRAGTEPAGPRGEARISRIAPEVDPAARAAFAEAELADPDAPALISGAAVRVTPAGEARRASPAAGPEAP